MNVDACWFRFIEFSTALQLENTLSTHLEIHKLFRFLIFFTPFIGKFYCLLFRLEMKQSSFLRKKKRKWHNDANIAQFLFFFFCNIIDECKYDARDHTWDDISRINALSHIVNKIFLREQSRENEANVYHCIMITKRSTSSKYAQLTRKREGKGACKNFRS